MLLKCSTIFPPLDVDIHIFLRFSSFNSYAQELSLRIPRKGMTSIFTLLQKDDTHIKGRIDEKGSTILNNAALARSAGLLQTQHTLCVLGRLPGARAHLPQGKQLIEDPIEEPVELIEDGEALASPLGSSGLCLLLRKVCGPNSGHVAS